MSSIRIDIPVRWVPWLACCQPEDARTLWLVLLAMSTNGRTPSPTIARSALPPTADLLSLVAAGIVIMDDQSVTIPELRKLAEARGSARERMKNIRATSRERSRNIRATPLAPLSPPHTPPLTPHPQNPEVGQTRAHARGVPASIRNAEPLEPNAEAVIAACERVTGRTPLKGYEVGACANWAAGMRFAYPDDKAVRIHGEASSLDAVIRAACEHATPQTVSSRGVTGILRWLESTVQSCIDGGVWPNERLAVTPPRAKIVADPKQRERDRALAEEVAKEMGRTG